MDIWSEFIKATSYLGTMHRQGNNKYVKFTVSEFIEDIVFGRQDLL